MQSSEELYLLYHGLLLPRETHSSESLKFAQEFIFKDDDVVAVTYPKSVPRFTRNFNEQSTVQLSPQCPIDALTAPLASKEELGERELYVTGERLPLIVTGRSNMQATRLMAANSQGTVLACTPKYFQHHGLLLPLVAHTLESLEYAKNFSVEDTDVFAVTYPKSGTVWMQEILPLVLNGGDLTPLHTIPNWDRVPWLEETRLSLVVDKLASPRALVTHLPYKFMPTSFYTSKAKAIYVMRNPKDVMVSSYYFHQMAGFLDDPGTFDEFMDKFLEGKVLFGKWTDHVKSWRHTELGDRIMYITYEEMVQDLPAALRRISDFLGRNPSEETIQKIAEQCSFKTMKNNAMSNFSLVPKIYMDSDKSPFLRKGVVGDWKEHFSSDQLARFTSVLRKELEGENSLPWSLD